MKKSILIALIAIVIFSCGKEEFNREIEIPEFDFPKTVVFQDSLSAYQIFQGTPSKLTPSEGFELLELSSVLFTDYSKKQRLVKIPAGTQMTSMENGSIDFPNGTILTKTFYYYKDDRDTSLGKRIIETRLEIKENDIWNVATYQWNDEQTEAILELDGKDTPVSWIDENGLSRSTVYHIPTENECMACHQSKATMAPLGPTSTNLNREIVRNGNTINQLTHLQMVDMLNDFDVNQINTIVDYNDMDASLEERGRAYLAMNCSHCHNPNSWERTAEQAFDFRYQTSMEQTGISAETKKITRVLQDREMPLLGTTLLDEEGMNLMLEYLESL